MYFTCNFSSAVGLAVKSVLMDLQYEFQSGTANPLVFFEWPDAFTAYSNRAKLIRKFASSSRGTFSEWSGTRRVTVKS